ncbi:MAG: quinolinate synthase NadA [Acidobacteria bacterium]|nr:quinolinate synthase NadA [Acidobacteriota bacterium]
MSIRDMPASSPKSTQNIIGTGPLEFTPEIERETAAIYERVRHVIPEIEWRAHAPYIYEIQKLKRQRNAIILAHNYQTPEIYHGVADLKGDSLALARDAVGVHSDVIVMCGVHFMAETAKILNPSKTVLIPDPEAGCSLAAAITAEDVRRLREQHPGVPVVTYVNTTAEVKAESDVCCTSANAVEVVESLATDRVIFIPDEFLGSYVASRTNVEVILWKGHCEVHEQFSAPAIQAYRDNYDDLLILAHPECSPEVLGKADFVGSTSGMIREVGLRQPKRVLMVTECSMSDNVAVEYPQIEFVRPCNLCPHMKRITLPGILDSLQSMKHVVDVDPSVAQRARRAVERMLAPAKRPAGSPSEAGRS